MRLSSALIRTLPGLNQSLAEYTGPAPLGVTRLSSLVRVRHSLMPGVDQPNLHLATTIRYTPSLRIRMPRCASGLSHQD